MAHIINITSKNKSGKLVTQNIPHLNPDASAADIKSFVKAFTSLSDNTVTAAQKIVKKDIGNDAPPVTIQGTDEADTLYSNYKGAVIEAGAGNDIVSLDGAINCTVNLGEGYYARDTLIAYNGASGNTIRAGEGNKTISLDGASGNLIEANDANVNLNAYNGADNNTITPIHRQMILRITDSNNWSVNNDDQMITATLTGASGNTIRGAGSVTLYSSSSDNLIECKRQGPVNIQSGSSNNTIYGAVQNASISVTSATDDGNIFYCPKNEAIITTPADPATLLVTGFSSNDSIVFPDDPELISYFNGDDFVINARYAYTDKSTRSLGHTISLKAFNGELNIFNAEGQRISPTVTPVVDTSTATGRYTVASGHYFDDKLKAVNRVFEVHNGASLSSSANNVSVIADNSSYIHLTGSTGSLRGSSNLSYSTIESFGRCNMTVYSSNKIYANPATSAASSISIGGSSNYIEMGSGWTVSGGSYNTITANDALYGAAVYSMNSSTIDLCRRGAVAISCTSCTISTYASGGGITYANNCVENVYGDSVDAGHGGAQAMNSVKVYGNDDSIHASSDLAVTLYSGQRRHIRKEGSTVKATITGFGGGDSLRLLAGTLHSTVRSDNDLYIHCGPNTTSSPVGYFLLKDIYDESGNRPSVFLHIKSTNTELYI